MAASPLVSYCGPNYIREATALPDDPLYRQGCQWWLTAIGADRVMDENLVPSPAAVTIAILDTGVYTTHEDLAGRMVMGADMIDSSGTGGVPLPVTLTAALHGTHVAGIAAAQANNQLGIAGTASATSVKIMPVRVLATNGIGNDYDISRGIVWAVDHGARVINMSLGGTSPSPIYDLAIQYARDHSCVVVVSAGNDALNTRGSPAVLNPVIYPAACVHVIAVAACDMNGAHADYSSYHDYVDVAAPGGTYVSVTTTQIISTIPYVRFLGDTFISRYSTKQGTSMAAPMVAGAAAMLLAQNPDLTPNEVEYLIISTAQRTGSLAVANIARDCYLGYGRLDLYRALTVGKQYMPTPTPAPDVIPAATYNFPNPFNPFRGEVTQIAIPLAPGEPGAPVKITIYNTTGRVVRRLEIAGEAVSTGKTVAWDGRNDQGDLVANGIYPYILTIHGKNHMKKIAVNNR